MGLILTLAIAAIGLGWSTRLVWGAYADVRWFVRLARYLRRRRAVHARAAR